MQSLCFLDEFGLFEQGFQLVASLEAALLRCLWIQKVEQVVRNKNSIYVVSISSAI